MRLGPLLYHLSSALPGHVELADRLERVLLHRWRLPARHRSLGPPRGTPFNEDNSAALVRRYPRLAARFR